MSSPVLYRYVGPTFERERYEEVDKEAQWLYEVDNAPEERGFRSKIKSFWKRTRINAVVKKVVTRSKDLLIRFASRLTPDATPPESDHSEGKIAARAIEQVNFPEDNSRSAGKSTASDDSARLDPTPLENDRLDAPILNDFPSFYSEKPITVNHKINDDPISEPASADKGTISSFRYKEQKRGKQVKFPEIEMGMVRVRVKWLEPFFSAKREPEHTLSLDKQGLSELEISKDEREGNPFSEGCESDGEYAFDDSPRLFKHRLPAEEPKPWVEPGTVAKGAMFLYPVLSGDKRARSGDSEQGNLASPTRVAHGIF